MKEDLIDETSLVPSYIHKYLLESLCGFGSIELCHPCEALEELPSRDPIPSQPARHLHVARKLFLLLKKKCHNIINRVRKMKET